MTQAAGRLILMVVRGLDAVGTGRQIELVAAGFRAAGWRVHIAVTTSGGTVAERLGAAGFPVHRLGARPRVDPGAAAKLPFVVRSVGPCVIHAWGRSQARIVGGLRGLLRPARTVCHLAVGPRDRFTAWSLRRADRVIVTSAGVAGRCEAFGVRSGLIDIIPPGIDAAAGTTRSREEIAHRLGLRGDSPWKTLADMLAAARARPGALAYSSSGSGSSLHLSGEMLKADAGVDILHVPFRGGADTANQLMGGRIDIGVNNLPSVITLLRGGQLRALAVTSPDRSPALPAVPTVAESGIPALAGYAATAWFGLQVPRATPPAIIDRLNAEVNAICAEPTTRERVEQLGARTRGGSVAEFTAYIAAENEKWAAVIRRSGAQVD